jgi:hypothetical protein
MVAMPLYFDINTKTVVDYPENVAEHPVLGRSLVPYVEPEDEAKPAPAVVVAATPSKKD